MHSYTRLCASSVVPVFIFSPVWTSDVCVLSFYLQVCSMVYLFSLRPSDFLLSGFFNEGKPLLFIVFLFCVMEREPMRCAYDCFIIWCRPESVESILCASLFPPEFPTKGRVKHWVKAVTHFDKIEMKALESILLQKQRSDFLSIDCRLFKFILSS